MAPAMPGFPFDYPDTESSECNITEQSPTVGPAQRGAHLVLFRSRVGEEAAGVRYRNLMNLRVRSSAVPKPREEMFAQVRISRTAPTSEAASVTKIHRQQQELTESFAHQCHEMLATPNIGIQ